MNSAVVGVHNDSGRDSFDCFMDITDEGLKLASFSPHDRESEA
jgi:hypothetical protein